MTVDGQTRIVLVQAHAPGALDAKIGARNVMGVRCPRVESLRPPETVDLDSLGASSTLAGAIAARHEEAQASVRCAIARCAHEPVARELARVARRRRAIERRWIPAHSVALAQLELALEEGELENAARVRLLVERTAK